MYGDTIFQDLSIPGIVIDQDRVILETRGPVSPFLSGPSDPRGEKLDEIIYPFFRDEFEKLLAQSTTEYRLAKGKVFPIDINENRRFIRLIVCAAKEATNLILVGFDEVEFDFNEQQGLPVPVVTKSRFIKLFDNIENLAVQGFDREGLIHYWNKSSEELYGYTAQEAVGKKITDLIYREDQKTDALNLFRQIEESGEKSRASEFRFLKKGRSTVSVFTNHTLVELPDHQPLILAFDIDLTKQKKIEAALRKSEEDLALIYNTLTDLIFTLSVEGEDRYRFTSVNYEFLKTTGLKREEIEGRLLHEVIPPANFDLIRNYYRAAVKTGLTQRWEETVEMRRGQRTGIVNITPILNQNGKCYQIIGSISDITERKAAEDVIKKIMERSIDVICTVNEYGEFVQVSQAAESVWGYTPDQLEGAKYLDLVHPEDVEKTKMMAENIRNGQVFTNFENRYIHKKGTIVPMIWSARWDKTDKLIYAVAKDASEIKKAEHLHMLSERRFKALIQEGVEMIAILDEKGKYTYVSPSNEVILGFTEKYLNSVNSFDLVHPDDVSEIREIFSNIHVQHKIKSPPYRIRKRNGEYLWAQSTATNLLHDESINGIVLNTIDLTDLMQAQEELRESESNYRTLFDFSPVPKWVFDLENGRVLDINQTVINHYEYSREQFIDKPISDIFPGSEKIRFEHAFSQFSESTESLMHFGIYTHLKADGTKIQVDISGNKVTYDGKSCLMLAGIDVTDKEKALQTLIENDQKLTRAQEIAQLGYWIFELKAQNFILSDQAARILEIDSSSFSNKLEDYLKIIHPDDLKSYTSAFEQTRETFSELDHQHRIITPDGKIKWIHHRAVVKRNGHIHNRILEGTAQDITRQKAEEQRLRLLEKVITNTSDAVMITETGPLDEAGPRIIFVNEAYTKMTGYSESELIGNSPGMLLGPKSNPIAIQKLRHAYKVRKSCEVEFIHYRKNGEPFWNNVSISPVTDESGKVTQWIAIQKDITNRKISEIQRELHSDISKVFNLQEELDEILYKVLACLSKGLDFCAAEVWIPSYDGDSVLLSASYGTTKNADTFFQITEKYREFSIGKGLPGRVLKTKDSVLWRNIGNKKTFIRHREAEKCGFRSAIGIPLSSGEGVHGVLVLFYDKDMRSYAEVPEVTGGFGEHIGTEIRRKLIELELNKIFEFAPDIICVSDVNDGYFKKINPAATSILEYSEEELMSRPILDFIHPDDREITEKELNALAGLNPNYTFENRWLTKSGKTRWLSWTTRHSHEKGRVYSVAKDVTEHKELEELLRKATDLARIGSWEVDLVNGTVYWSAMTREIMEVDSGYIPTLEKGLAAYKEGEHREKISHAVNKSIETGEPFDLELVIITEKKNERWVRAIGQAELVNGKAVRLLGSFQDIHRRKQAETSYKALLQERVTILESISDAFYALDKNFNFTYFNNEAENLLEISAPEVLGKNIWDVFPPAFESELYKTYQYVIKHQEPKTLEYMYPPSGKWYEFSAYPNPDGISVYFKNVTERKKAADALRQAYEEKTNILESIGDAFFAVDKNWSVTYWNKQAESALGIPRKQVVNKNLWEVFEDMTGLEFYRHACLAMEKNTTVFFQEFNPTVKKWFEVTAFPSPEGLSVYFKDITLRKDIDNKIRESNKRFEMVAEATSDAIWDWDTETDSIFWGIGFKNLFGWEPDEMAPTLETWTKNVHPEDRDRVYKSILNAVENPKVSKWSSEYRYQRKDGSYAFVFDRGAVIRDSEGNATRMVGAMQDITNQKEYEDSLERLNAELQNSIRELAMSNADLEQFAYVASHDLQEPLRMVTSFLTQLERKYDHLLDEKGRQYIYFATDGAKRMRRIILDLLEFSRVGRIESKKEIISPGELIDEVLKLNYQLIQETGAEINLGELPEIFASRTAIQQVFQNLISNALKYQPAGNKPVIEIQGIADDNQVAFSIKDNGIGINPDYSDKIFNIFQRLHSRDEYSGTGVGLAICKKVVEHHGGKIWVEPGPDRGSVFKFTIPVQSWLATEAAED